MHLFDIPVQEEIILFQKAIHEKDIILPVPVRFWIYKVLNAVFPMIFLKNLETMD